MVRKCKSIERWLIKKATPNLENVNLIKFVFLTAEFLAEFKANYFLFMNFRSSNANKKHDE